jgi:hypothetical protein
VYICCCGGGEGGLAVAVMRKITLGHSGGEPRLGGHSKDSDCAFEGVPILFLGVICSLREIFHRQFHAWAQTTAVEQEKRLG